MKSSQLFLMSILMTTSLTVNASALQGVGCDHQSEIIEDQIKEYLISQADLPFPQIPNFKTPQSPILQKEIDHLIKLWFQEVPQIEKIDSHFSLLKFFSEVTAGASYNPNLKIIGKKHRALMNIMKTKTDKIKCKNPELESQWHFNLKQLQTFDLAEAANFSLATTYQSCQSARLPALDTHTPDVAGIAIVGSHNDGVGKKRVIANLSEVQSTHYYIKDESYSDASCFNVKSSPLIYDYGGKPYASTAAGARLNFFKNAGDGTKVLGYDCSGFVFTSLATAGKRTSPGRVLKASDVLSYGSTAYVNPQSNGLKCLDRIWAGSKSDLLPGDIVAVPGHILIIESIENDPLNLSNFTQLTDCDKISSRDFRFVVIQSSNSKSGIGINKYQASAYLQTSEKMRLGFESFAKQVCINKIKGTHSQIKINQFSVVRHAGTPECLSDRVRLEKEECVQSCQLQAQ